MRRALERLLDPDTFLKVWAGVMLAWIVAIVAIAVMVVVAFHFIGKHW